MLWSARVFGLLPPASNITARILLCCAVVSQSYVCRTLVLFWDALLFLDSAAACMPVPHVQQQLPSLC